MSSENGPNVTEINISAEVKKLLGPKWNEPEVEYRFSNGREFKRRTGDAAIYATSPDFAE